MVDRKRAESVSLGALFIAFLKISLYGFGGGLVWARRIAVEQHGWLSEDEFADIVTFASSCPGPTSSASRSVSGKPRGLIGSIAAVCGFVLIPWAAGFSFGVLYLRHTHLAVLQNILGGVSAVGAGLLIATGIRMLTLQRNRPQAFAAAALAVGGIVFTKLPLLVVLFGLVLLNTAVAKIRNAGT